MANQPIIVRGAGLAGLWQAFTLARRGHGVRVVERSPEPLRDACSMYAGAMLAPYCEEEAAEPLIRELGLRSLAIWRDVYPEHSGTGSLVLTQPRDRRELDRFARMTSGHERIDGERIAALEPDLAGRFQSALFYPEEGHVEPAKALAFLLDAARDAGAAFEFGSDVPPSSEDRVIDCRGLAARDTLTDLRGVRGERAILRSADVTLARPVRLLHPRFPIYVVPWSDGRFMIGATQIESEATGETTLRSALELLSTAYALHPSFGEAEIIELGAGLRPAFPDNLPRVVVKDRHIYVNGLFRHGFILAPALAELVADYLETGATHKGVFRAGSGER